MNDEAVLGVYLFLITTVVAFVIWYSWTLERRAWRAEDERDQWRAAARGLTEEDEQC